MLAGVDLATGGSTGSLLGWLSCSPAMLQGLVRSLATRIKMRSEAQTEMYKANIKLTSTCRHLKLNRGNGSLLLSSPAFPPLVTPADHRSCHYK